jgi:VCBS repeat-containing protein
VLVNDSDLDGDTLTSAVVTTVTHGSLTLNPNGGFTYTPNSNYFGSDTFTYRASDGMVDSGLATVTINVTELNRPPVAADDNYVLGKNSALTVTVPGVLVNDTDLDGNALTAIMATSTTHGSLALNANGGFTYTPVSNYFGADSFTYRANDGVTDSAIATVTLTITNINRAPVAADDSYTLAKNSSLTVTAPGVLSNDDDLDGDPLTLTEITSTAHGIVTLNLDGSFTYTPSSNYFGADSFTYRLIDSSATSGVATVTLTITNLNRAPVANDDAFTLGKNSSILVPASGVLGNDLDLDGDSLAATVITSAAHGTLTLDPNGSFTYTPASNYFGADTFTYRANDGVVDSGIATVTLTITNVNRLPVAIDDTYSLGKNSSLTLSAPGVLVNDSDLDGDPLTAVIVSSTTHGNVVLNANGSFSYIPVSNYFGVDSFTYQANDGATNSSVATVNLLITNTPFTGPQFGILKGSSVFNPQTGLFEQNVTVTNIGDTTAPAVRLLVDGLRSSVSLYNASGTNAGRPYVQHNSPLDPNQTMRFVLEFFVGDRRPFTNSLEAQSVLPASDSTDGASSVAISRMFIDRRISGRDRFVLEFASIPGRTYTIIYSDDNMQSWHAATPSLTANATRTQWYDDGPPKTSSVPLSNVSRLYRVIVAPANP